MNRALSAVRAYGYLAEPLIFYDLVVQIEHVIERLVNAFKVQKNSNNTSFHTEDDIINEFVLRFLTVIVLEITAQKNLVLLLCLSAFILHKLNAQVLIISYQH